MLGLRLRITREERALNGGVRGAIGALDGGETALGALPELMALQRVGGLRIGVARAGEVPQLLAELGQVLEQVPLRDRILEQRDPFGDHARREIVPVGLLEQLRRGPQGVPIVQRPF